MFLLRVHCGCMIVRSCSSCKMLFKALCKFCFMELSLRLNVVLTLVNGGWLCFGFFPVGKLAACCVVIFTLPRELLQSIAISASVCLSVYLSNRISPEPYARSLPTFLCLLSMSMARSSGMLVIGRIAYRQKGGDGSAQRRRRVIYSCLVSIEH